MSTRLNSISFLTLLFLINVELDPATSICKKAQTSELGGWVNASIRRGSTLSSKCTFNFTSSLQKAFEEAENIKDLRISYELYVSEETSKYKPLLFTIKRQLENVKTFKLPFTYFQEPFSKSGVLSRKSKEWFYVAGGTLCVDQTIRNGSIGSTQLQVKVETSAGSENYTIHFGIRFQASSGLFLRLNDNSNDSRTITPILSPTVSTYYGFDFSNKNVRNVTIVVRSLVPNPPCSIISIQTPLCPVQDTEHTVLFEGKSQAILSLGVEYVYQKEYEDRDAYAGGFALIIVVLSEDSRCDPSQHHPSVQFENRTNIFDVRILPSKWDPDKAPDSNFYVRWILPFIASSGIFAAVIIAWILVSLSTSKEEVTEEYRTNDTTRRILGKFVYVKDIVLSDFIIKKSDTHHADPQHHFLSDTIVTTIHYFTALVIVIMFRIITMTETTDLSICYYNKLCAYQFEILSPMWIKFFVWNSIISSAVFSIAGLHYLIYLIYIRHKFLPGKTFKDDSIFGSSESNEPLTNSVDSDSEASSLLPVNNEVINESTEATTLTPILHDGNIDLNQFGIPDKFGLELALGGVLILEGILSAMYHVCPNFGSFLFDAPVMDLILILSWIRIHQLRYPVYMTTYWTTVIAISNILFEICLTLGHYKHKTHSDIYIAILFFKVFFFNVLVVTHSFYMYYLGHYRLIPKTETATENVEAEVVTELSEIFKLWWYDMWTRNEMRSFASFSPSRPYDFAVMFVTVVVNMSVTWTLFGLYVYSHAYHGVMNPEIMLNITEYNIMFAIATHMLRRFYHENLFHRSNLVPTLCFLLHIIAHFAQFQLYNTILFDWSETHALSMKLNEECLDGVYDYHDYYHFFKAMSFFFLFMVLTTINDGCAYMKREFIQIF